jgi:hypothetical protein
MKRPAAKSPPGPWNELVTKAQQIGEAVLVQGGLPYRAPGA